LLLDMSSDVILFFPMQITLMRRQHHSDSESYFFNHFWEPLTEPFNRTGNVDISVHFVWITNKKGRSIEQVSWRRETEAQNYQRINLHFGDVNRRLELSLNTMGY